MAQKCKTNIVKRFDPTLGKTDKPIFTPPSHTHIIEAKISLSDSISFLRFPIRTPHFLLNIVYQYSTTRNLG